MSDIVVFLSTALAEDARIIGTEITLRSGDPYFSSGERSQFEREFDVVWAAREGQAKCDLLAVHRRYSRDDDTCVGCGFGSDEEPIVPDISDCPVLRALVLVYRHRPGFDPAWVSDVETRQRQTHAVALMDQVRERTRGHFAEGEIDAAIDELRGKRVTEPSRADRAPIEGHTDQPMPVSPDPTVSGAHEVVCTELRDMGGLTEKLRWAAVNYMTGRAELGWKRYGQRLVPNDERDRQRDALEEAADLVAYLADMRRSGGLANERTYHFAVTVFLDLVAQREGVEWPW